MQPKVFSCSSSRSESLSATVDYSLAPETAPIGIFDSGVGGITVLRELYEQLPQESVLYFGDTAKLPYGTKSQAEIIQFVRDILDWMVQQGCKMAIMACNTSSALALDAVRDEYELPILGLILPGAQAAVRQGRRIGVISTPATAASGAYGSAIREINPEAEVFQVGCPEFVHIVEQGRIAEAGTRAIAQLYLEPLIQRKIDTLVYGCTHYPHLAPVLQQLLHESVTLVDPAESVVAAASRELDAMGLKNFRQPLSTRFCVSSAPQHFAQISSQWLGYSPRVELITLPQNTRSVGTRLERTLERGVEAAVDIAVS